MREVNVVALVQENDTVKVNIAPQFDGIVPFEDWLNDGLFISGVGSEGSEGILATHVQRRLERVLAGKIGGCQGWSLQHSYANVAMFRFDFDEPAPAHVPGEVPFGESGVSTLSIGFTRKHWPDEDSNEYARAVEVAIGLISSTGMTDEHLDAAGEPAGDQLQSQIMDVMFRSEALAQILSSVEHLITQGIAQYNNRVNGES